MPGHHAPRYDAIDRRIAAAGDRARRLGDLVKVVPVQPAAGPPTDLQWLVRRSGGELLIEPSKEPADGLLLVPLPERAILMSTVITRGAEVADWGEDLYQGPGALVLPRQAVLTEVLIL